MRRYKLNPSFNGMPADMVQRIEGDDVLHVPIDRPDNRHSAEYAQWLADGHQPEPADDY